MLDVRVGSPLAPANAAAVQHVVASIAASALDPLSEARLRAVADDPRAQLMTTPRVGGGGALGSPEAVVRRARLCVEVFRAARSVCAIGCAFGEVLVAGEC